MEILTELFDVQTKRLDMKPGLLAKVATAVRLRRIKKKTLGENSARKFNPSPNNSSFMIARRASGGSVPHFVWRCEWLPAPGKIHQTSLSLIELDVENLTQKIEQPAHQCASQ
jgi:hypothetical protein